MNEEFLKKIENNKKLSFSWKSIILIFSGIWEVLLATLRIPQNSKKSQIVVTRKKKKGRKRKFFKKLILFLLIFILLFSGALALWISQLTIPSIEEIKKLNIAQSTKIFDRQGELLFNIYGDENRTVVSIDDISQNLINATIAIEDKDFHQHIGIKPTSILKSAWENFRSGKHVRGGSTITQQVIKNTVLTREKTYTRKIKEAILALKLEKIWTKNQILELYLNESPYGGIIYGIEEAANFYFGIRASDLGIAQSAYLAAMPQAPSIFSPHGENRDKLDARKNLILSLMLEQGHINLTEYQESKTEEVEFKFKTARSGIKAPHFVMFVIAELEKKFTQEELRGGGLRIQTTLDLKLQDDLQEIVKNKVAENEEKYQLENGAAIVIDSKTGHILAMIGSRDYFDKKIDGKFNVATAKRQPGSAFKPIVFLTALQEGYTPDTVVWDVPTEFSFNCLHDGEKRRADAVCYKPQNFDFKFKGPIKLRYALPESRNIPAVKVLHLVGVADALKNAKLLGIKSLDQGQNFYGLNLVLGGGEVKLLNLVSAYSVFSNNGLRTEPRAITKIIDFNGEILYEPTIEKIRIMEEKEILWLSKILYTNEYKYKTFGWESPLYYLEREVAVKTGTTDNYRDSWTVGYDPSVTVGIWLGNNDNTSMKPSRTNHSLWREVMDRVLKDYPQVDFKKPEEIDYKGLKPILRGIWQGNKIIKIDTKNNTLATAETPENFIKEIIIPEYHSILHWINKNDPLNPLVPTPEERDDLYENWEAGVQEWVLENKDLMSEEMRKIMKSIFKKKVNNENALNNSFNNFREENLQNRINTNQGRDLEAEFLPQNL